MMRLNKIIIIDQRVAIQVKGNFTGHRVDQMIVNIVEENTNAEIVLLLVRHVTSVNAKIILQMYVGPKTDLNQEVESRKNLMVVHAQNKNYRRVPLKPDFLGALKSVWLISNPAYQY